MADISVNFDDLRCVDREMICTNVTTVKDNSDRNQLTLTEFLECHESQTISYTHYDVSEDGISVHGFDRKNCHILCNFDASLDSKNFNYERVHYRSPTLYRSEAGDSKSESEIVQEKLRTFQKSLSDSTNIEWINQSIPYDGSSESHQQSRTFIENAYESNQDCRLFQDFPVDIMLIILSFLDDNSLRMLQRVNRAMRHFLIKVSEFKTIVWTQACRQRWPWLGHFLPDDIFSQRNPSRPKLVFVDSLNLPTPLEFVTIDRTILNYGLLLSLAPSSRGLLSRDKIVTSRVNRSNQSLLISSSINMMEIDDTKFTPTMLHFPFVNDDLTKFRFVKDISGSSASDTDGSPTRKWKIKLGSRGGKFGGIMKLLRKHRVSPVVNNTNGVAARKDCAFVLQQPTTLKYFWKPFVIPFASSHYKNPQIKEMELMPRLVSYFEITILPQAVAGTNNDSQYSNTRVQQNQNNQGHETSECVAIGVANESFPLNGRMPGWDIHSFGYHGDDGHIYHGSGRRSRITVQLRQNRQRRRHLRQPQIEIRNDNAYGPRYGVNDTVGCGIDYCNQAIFFTYNGTFLGYAFSDLPLEMLQTTTFYPVVGIDNNCPIHCNFGYQDPFTFNLSAYILKYQKQKLYQTLVYEPKS